MIALCIKNFQRLWQRKGVVVFMMSLTLLALIVAVGSTLMTPKYGNIAVKGSIDHEEAFNVTYVDHIAMSELVSNRYDAFIDEGVIVSIKSEASQANLEKVLQQGMPEVTLTQETIGQRIMQFMTMFILMQGGYLLFLVGDDLMDDKYKRMMTTPLTHLQYLLGNAVFMVGFIVMNAMLWLGLARVLGHDIGYSLWLYLVKVTGLGLFGVGFSLCIISFVKKTDTATMASQAVLIITTLIANMSQTPMFEALLKYLPQNAINQSNGGYYVMILGVSAILFGGWRLGRE